MTRMRTFLVLVLALAVTGSGPGGDEAARSRRARTERQPAVRAGPPVSPHDVALLRAAPSLVARADGAENIAIARQGKNNFAVFHVEFKNEEARKNFKVNGAYVFNEFERFADLFVEEDAKVQSAVFEAPGIAWIDVGRRNIFPPPPPVSATPGKTKAVPDLIVRGGIKGLTGKGVIIAILDTGLDFHHPDFISYDEDGKPTSRLLYFWDTTRSVYNDQPGRKAPVSYPNGASIGVVYSQDDLTADLRSPASRIPVWDTNGHGTACASIAAGNNRKGKPAADRDVRAVGAAPEADIIAVRLGEETMENSYLLGSICSWLDQIAGNKPVVISCSFGGQFGGHDGFLVVERQIDARFPLERKGRAICIAAGNEGYRPLHAEVSFQGETGKGALKWTSSGGAWLDIHCDTDEDLQLELRPINKEQEKVYKEQTKIYKYVHGLTRQVVVNIVVPSGPAELDLFNGSGKKMLADAYISGPGAFFDPQCAVYGKQIATPGTVNNAITVGSYDWNDLFHQWGEFYTYKVMSRDGFVDIRVGSRSAYSNPGYSRSHGVIKPDLVAPGQYFTAAAATNTRAFLRRDSSGLYQLFNGTSAATPYTAGVVALVFQKKPTLTLGELKKLFQNHCTQDRFTTEKKPSPGWGYGKLDYKAAEKILDALE